MSKKHSAKTIRQSVPQCYEPLWNIWHTGRLLWQGDSCILYELLAENKEAQRLLLFPLDTAFLENIKIFSCQQDLEFSCLKSYTIFEDCICLRLSAITPVSLITDRLTTNGLQFFYFVKDSFSLLFKLAVQGIWLSDFTLEDIAFLPNGVPILFCFHKTSHDSDCHPLQDLCKLLETLCKKMYPSCLVYLEQLFAQCGISDIYQDTHTYLPPNALLEFYTLLIEGTEILYTESKTTLAAIPGTMETLLVSSPEIYDVPSSATEFQKEWVFTKRRRICAIASLLILMTCLCIVFIFHSTNRQTHMSGNVQATFHATLTSRDTSATKANDTISPISSVPKVSSAPVLSSTTPPTDTHPTASPPTSTALPVPTSTPEPIPYLDLHSKALHLLPEPETISPIWTLDCSNNVLTSLSGLSEYTDIYELYANDNQITCLDAICTQKNIHVLLLQNNHLTDIMPLQDLSGLEHLDVSGNQSLQDITILFHMPSLQFVNLMNTGVSKKDIQKLHEAIPNCEILPEIL